MKSEHPDIILKWLQSQPSREELGREFPELQEVVRREVAEIVADGKSAGLTEYLKQMNRRARILETKLRSRSGDTKISSIYVQQIVQSRMAHLAIKQHLISEATGIEKGRVRFNLLNGYVAQKLLFSTGLERKPVSMFWFRLAWPLLWQRRLLMPLVQPQGIYCFYSRQLINKLAAIIGTRSCLEMAAGDGTLTRFLCDRGTKVVATDDYSWSHEVNYPEFVIKMAAREALREYKPEVALCSWPPDGNSFEQQVFKTKSVQMYIVISSRHRFAAGNWDDYRQQTTFDIEEDSVLTRLILPPELDAGVYVFRRKRME